MSHYVPVLYGRYNYKNLQRTIYPALTSIETFVASIYSLAAKLIFFSFGALTLAA
jgi:hypothetical protein